ncbi:MAG: nuclease-related domain-containing protein [Chloroflexi bacterium OHK40]
MAVQVWIGEKPEHPNERRAIVALAQGLDRLDGLYLILANFSVGGRSVDLVIIKHDAIFIIELKHCDGRVLGSVNGPWFVEGRNGERKRLNPGRKNPYNQVISYFHALTNYLNEHRREFLSAQKASDIDFRTCKRVVVIAPSIQEGSEIELDWKVELKGMDELPSYLITERSSEIELSDEEMLAIPVMLHCTPWQEINTVLRGILADPVALADPTEMVTHRGASPGGAAGAPAPTVEEPRPIAAPPAPESVPEPAPPRSFWQRTRAALGTTTGRVAAAMATLAAVLFLALLLRPTRLVPLPDQPPAPLAEITGVPTGAAGATSAGLPEAACRWSGAQLVGKRFDAATQSWLSVAQGGSSAIIPEVVVALEQVSTCSGTIELTWSVQNNSDREVEFPLRNDNVRISDSLGNEYLLDDEASSPPAMRVAPGGQERGTAVVSRPLSSAATALLVRLREQPFGEASFVVAVQP